MKKNIIYCMVLVFLVASCRKQKNLPEPEVTQAYFYVSCDMDGDPLLMEAGNEDYYMNASWYHEDSASLFVYKGHLAKQSGEGYKLTILFNDVRKSASSKDIMYVDSALRIGQHLYDDQNPSGFTQKVDFVPLKGESEGDYSWHYTDGINVKDYTNTYSISPILSVGTIYSVSLTYSDFAGVCSTTHTNVFKAGGKVQTNITAARDMSASEPTYDFSYSLPTYTPASWKCLWRFGDNTTTTTVNPKKVFFPNSNSVVKLKLTDTMTGDTCISYYQLNVPLIASQTPCDANYKASFAPIQNNRLYASVTVLLTDPNGTVYSSKALVQPESSSFEVLEVGDYQPNNKAEPTKSLKVRFNCVVKNGGKEINLNNGNARIAVAYK